jgi:hypothetical protein
MRKLKTPRKLRKFTPDCRFEAWICSAALQALDGNRAVGDVEQHGGSASPTLQGQYGKNNIGK